MDVTNSRVKIFGKKNPYFVTQIQNIKHEDLFRYKKVFCKLSPLNPFWFFYTNKEGVTNLEKVVDHVDKFVAVPMKKIKTSNLINAK